MEAADLHQAVGEVANRTVAAGVQPAHGAQFWEFLQHEIQVTRRTAASSLQIGTTIAAGFVGLILLGSASISIRARPNFAFGMLARFANRPHLVACAIPVRDLHQLPATLAARRRPPRIFGPEDLLGIIMQEDNSDFRWFCPVSFGNIRRRLPDHVQPTEYLALKHKVIESLWMAVLIPGFRRFSDRNFDRYREFLQSNSAFIVC